MSYDDTSFYGDMIVDEYDDKCNFIGTNTPMGYLAYHLLGDGFDLMSDMCSKFMNDFNILTADSSSLDKFWGVSYNMPRPSLPYLYTVLFEDVGVTTNTNYTSFYNYTVFNPQVSDTGTLLTNNVATTYNYFANLDSTSDLYDFKPPFTVEFDIVSFSGASIGTQIVERGQNGAIRNFSQLGITKPCHLKLIVDGTQIIYQVDNETVMTQNYTVTQGRVSLILNSATLEYKNFRIEGIVYPNIYFDDATTDTNSRYYINGAGGTSLTWNNGYLVLTLGSSSRYVGLRTTQYDVNNLIGKKVHFEAEIDADTISYVQLLDDNTGTVYTRATGNEITKGVSQLEYTIPSNCTQVLFQIMPKDQSGSGGTIKFKNFKIYTMENPIYSTRLLSDEEYRIYLYLRNCRLITKEDLLINFNKCFGFDDYPIVFSDEAFYLEATDHLNYEPTDTVSSNLHKNANDNTLHFVTDYSNDETTETIESGLTIEEELVTAINIPYNNWDKDFLEMLEQYISIKGNIKIKEYTL